MTIGFTGSRVGLSKSVAEVDPGGGQPDLRPPRRADQREHHGAVRVVERQRRLVARPLRRQRRLGPDAGDVAAVGGQQDANAAGLTLAGLLQGADDLA